MATDLARVAKSKGIKYFLVSFTDLFGVLRAKLVPARAIGAMQTDTCINYQTILPPVRGEHVAFGDTGVVIYSNSVLGAFSNFEGGPSALAAGLTAAPDGATAVRRRYFDSFDWRLHRAGLCLVREDGSERAGQRQSDQPDHGVSHRPAPRAGVEPGPGPVRWRSPRRRSRSTQGRVGEDPATAPGRGRRQQSAA